MSSVCQVLGILRPSPSTWTLPPSTVVFLMSWFWPTTTGLLGFKQFFDSTESGCDEGNLSKDVSLEDGEGDDTKEERDKGSELELQESQDGEEFLQLLLFFASAWKGENIFWLDLLKSVKVNEEKTKQFYFAQC